MGAGDLEAVGMVTPTLAHMGGIDEIGVFLIPALLAVFALRWAEKRARRRGAAENEISDPDPVSSPQPPAEHFGTENS